MKSLVFVALLLGAVKVASAQSANFSITGSYAQVNGGEGGIYAVNGDGTGYRLIRKFEPNADGQNPVGKLLRTSDGYIYGVAQYGGSGNGTIYEVKEDGTGFKVIHMFETPGMNPQGGLVLGANGFLFGVTNSGGQGNGGTIYKVKRDGTEFSKVHDFGARELGRQAALVVDTDGILYGAGSNSTTEHAIFKLNADGTGFTILHNFTGMPVASLVTGELLVASDGNLYGTSAFDGANSVGTIFRIAKNGSGFTRLMDFPASFPQDVVRGLVEVNGKIYGAKRSSTTGNAAVFRVDLNGTNLVEYTTSIAGGTGALIVGTDKLIVINQKAAFRMDLDGNSVEVLHDFDSFSENATPVFTPSGEIIGVRNYGFESGNGCIFKITPNATFSILKEFPQPEGAHPRGNLFDGGDGFIYGMTLHGGHFGTGVIFRMSRDGEVFTVIHDVEDIRTGFGGLNLDYVGLVLISDGFIYARTMRGPNNGHGTLFRVSLDGQEFEELIAFDEPTSGSHPSSTLLEGSDGKLYGINGNGGTTGAGTIYKIDKDGSNFVKLHDFSGLQAFGIKLVEGSDNYLVGMAYTDATNSAGGIFRIKMDGSGFEVTKSFDASTGAGATGGTLVKHPNGKLYGMTKLHGGGSPGRLFSLNADGTNFQSVYSFGSHVVENGLTLGADGFFYGHSSPADFNDITTRRLFRIKEDGTGFRDFLLPHSLLGNTKPLNPNLTMLAKIPQTIDFPAPAALTFGNAPSPVIATSQSGLPVAFASGNEAVATFSGNMITLKGAGQIDITASQAGDGLYEAATPVVRSLTINKGSQTITFPDITAKTLGGAPFNPGATASSGLAVSYTTTSDKVSIAGAAVTMVKAGRVSLTANQAGNTNYLAATAEEKSFCINPAKPTVTFAIESAALTLTSSNGVGNQWYRNSTLISGATQTKLEMTEPGNYTVKSTVDDCVSELSEPFAMSITGVDVAADAVVIHGNPVSDFLTASVTSNTERVIRFELIDLMGRSIHARTGRTNKEEVIEMKHQPAGLYFLRVFGGGLHAIERVVKQ